MSATLTREPAVGGLLVPAPDWASHLAVHGQLPTLSGPQLLDDLDRSELRGRGGGGFPTACKLRAAAEHGRGSVIANWSEGEPASSKDAALREHAPHLVIDGALLAARATRARKVVVAVHEGAPARRVRAVLAERTDSGHVEVLEVPDRYVAGEASALVRALAGGPHLPQQRSTRLAAGRRPHLVQNAETLACLALLARGRPASTTLVTVRGAVLSPGVRELPLGTSLRTALGGLSAPVQALLVGGYHGRWLTPAQALDAPLSHDGLRAVGGTLGAGVVIALPESACGLAATADVLHYLTAQSARQCGPCLNGLPAMAQALAGLAAGGSPAGTLDRLERWCGLVRGRGACAHPDGAAALVASSLRVFAADARLHLARSCGRPAGDAAGVPQ